MKRYFITGTDTDCGKTYVTAGLVRAVANSAAIKPVASGCIEHNGQLISSDAWHLQQARHYSLDLINPWLFKTPVSPHIAAAEEGALLLASEIADYCKQLELPGVEHLFIEGAGGLMVPLNNDDTWIDFLTRTQFPVILVVGVKLGCINHALLTESVLRAHQIPCHGWIANCIDAEMLALEANINTLKSRINAPLLTIVPYGGEVSSIDL
jgi:dethiobiotin synthetase